MAIRTWILAGIALLLLILFMIEIRHKVLVGRINLGNDRDSIFWEWGILYFNPEDSRIVVPKRIESLGWTLNFSRPSAFMFVLALVLVVVFLTTR